MCESRSQACLSLFLLCLAAIGSGSAAAATYYVDPANGNDSGSGAQNSSWKTVAKAQLSAAGGDTVLLAGGNYGEVVISKKTAGRAGWNQAITFKAAPGAVPVFSYLSISGVGDCYFEFSGVSIAGEPRKSCVQISDSSHIRLVRMNLKGFWSVHNAAAGLYGVAVAGSGKAELVSDITVDGCQISDVVSGLHVSGHIGTDIILKNDTIHHFGGTGISIEPSNKDTSGNVLIDRNNISNKEVLIEKLVASGDFTGSFTSSTKGENVSQKVAGGTATGIAYTKVKTQAGKASGNKAAEDTEDANNLSPGTRNLIIVPTSPNVYFEFGSGKAPIVGAGGASLNNPHLDSYAASHGSGISIRANNVTVSANIIHDCGPTRGIRSYQGVFPQTGYHNLKIENNLVYDIANTYAVELVDVGDNCSFNDNTIIGYHEARAAMGKKYANALTLSPASGKDGGGFEMYNNILVGQLNISRGFTGDNENNNTIWSVFDHNYGAKAVYRQALKGDKTKIIAWDKQALNPLYFEGPGNFFKGGPDFDKYGYTRVTKVLHPYAGPVENRPHSQDLSQCYMLSSNSPARGAGDAAHTPPADLLGNPRNVAKPDIGCYQEPTSKT